MMRWVAQYASNARANSFKTARCSARCGELLTIRQGRLNVATGESFVINFRLKLYVPFHFDSSGNVGILIDVAKLILLMNGYAFKESRVSAMLFVELVIE